MFDRLQTGLTERPLTYGGQLSADTRGLNQKQTQITNLHKVPGPQAVARLPPCSSRSLADVPPSLANQLRPGLQSQQQGAVRPGRAPGSQPQHQGESKLSLVTPGPKTGSLGHPQATARLLNLPHEVGPQPPLPWAVSPLGTCL